MQNQKSNAGVIWAVVIVIVIIIGVIIYYSNSNSRATVSTPAVTTSSGQTSNAPMIPYYTVSASSTPGVVGGYLMAANGMPLYTYGKDTVGISNCTGACLTAWPPYTVSASDPLSGSSGIASKIGWIKRADGTRQVTYAGLPLYFFKSDTTSGQVTGNGVGGFAVAKP